MKNKEKQQLLKDVIKAIETNKYYYNVQFCHPEHVKDSIIEQMEQQAEELIIELNKAEIAETINTLIEELDELPTTSQVLTDAIRYKINYLGTQTTTVLIITT